MGPFKSPLYRFRLFDDSLHTCSLLRGLLVRRNGAGSIVNGGGPCHGAPDCYGAFNLTFYEKEQLWFFFVVFVVSFC